MSIGDQIVKVCRDGTLWHQGDREPYIEMLYSEWAEWTDARRVLDEYEAFVEQQFKEVQNVSSADKTS